MKKRRLFFGGLLLLVPLALSGCFLDQFLSKETPQEEEKQKEDTTPEEQNEGNKQQEEEDKTDYGKVTFKTIYIYADQYGNYFDEVPIRPNFTKPEVCQNEVFEYEIKNDSICYIENNFVYALGETGTTKVTARSKHLTGTFTVNVQDHYNNNYAFSVAKSLANTASHTSKQGTTLFIGDSFFEFWRNKTGVDENFATAFSGYDVANAGISGTQAREWRSLRKAIVDPYQPKNIVLNIGINDIDDNNEDGESTANYIMMLCEDIWLTNPNCNIYYQSITRCTGVFASKWQFHSASNEFMKVNAQNNAKLHYLDVMEVYGDNYANYLQSDGLHPNTAGYEVMKTLIKANVPLETL